MNEADLGRAEALAGARAAHLTIQITTRSSSGWSRKGGERSARLESGLLRCKIDIEEDGTILVYAT